MKCVCEQSGQLEPGAISKEAYSRSHLRKLAVNVELWERLWECPDTGLLWREWHPHPEMQAGGPSHFSLIERDEARRRFGSIGDKP